MRTAPTALRFLRRLTAVATATLFAFIVALFSTAPAHAQAPPPPGDDAQLASAKQYFEAGKNAYNAGDYTGAIRAFKEAERLRPSPLLDYNIGLANEKLGKRRVAVKYYRRFLELAPNAQNRPQVEASIAQLEREIAAQPGGPAPGAPVEQPSDMPPAPTYAPAPQPTYPQAQPQPGQPPAYNSYDPYAQQQPVQAGGYYTQPPPKKKSYWWVALIVVGGVVLITCVAVAAYFLTRPTYYYATTGGVTTTTTPSVTTRLMPSSTPEPTPTLLNFTKHF